MPIISASAIERSPAPSWPLAMPCSKADTEPRVCSICVQNKQCHVPRETTSVLQQGTLRPHPFHKQDFNFNTFRDPLDTFFQRRSPLAVPPDPSPPTGEDQHLSLPGSSTRPQPQHLHVLTLLVVIKWSSQWDVNGHINSTNGVVITGAAVWAGITDIYGGVRWWF